jgi:ABC-2 type transport system ATP-binding protein
MKAGAGTFAVWLWDRGEASAVSSGVSLGEMPGSGAARARIPALRVQGLRKEFSAVAVDNLDLTVCVGELYALLGPNGAGKTTTLRMIAGLLPPDSGSIAVFGIDALADPVAAKRVTAWLPDEPMIYDKLSPLEYLEFVAGLWGVERERAERNATELLEVLELADHTHARCEGFSRGMKQKVALAGALIHDPRLIMLDEPLTGLDAAIARQVKDLLTERVRAGATIILTTHILEVAERLADRIGIVDHGRLIAEGTLPELKSALGSGGSATLEDVFLAVTGKDARSA